MDFLLVAGQCTLQPIGLVTLVTVEEFCVLSGVVDLDVIPQLRLSDEGFTTLLTIVVLLTCMNLLVSSENRWRYKCFAAIRLWTCHHFGQVMDVINVRMTRYECAKGLATYGAVISLRARCSLLCLLRSFLILAFTFLEHFIHLFLHYVNFIMLLLVMSQEGGLQAIHLGTHLARKTLLRVINMAHVDMVIQRSLAEKHFRAHFTVEISYPRVGFHVQFQLATVAIGLATIRFRANKWTFFFMGKLDMCATITYAVETLATNVAHIFLHALLNIFMFLPVASRGERTVTESAFKRFLPSVSTYVVLNEHLDVRRVRTELTTEALLLFLVYGRHVTQRLAMVFQVDWIAEKA